MIVKKNKKNSVKIKKAKEKKAQKKTEMDKLRKVIEKQTGGKVKIKELNFNPKKMVIWLLVIFFVAPFFLSLMAGPLPVDKIGMSQLLTDIKENKIEKIEVEEERILVNYIDREGIIESRKEAGESFVEILDRAGIEPTAVNFETKDTSTTRAWQGMLEILLPVVLTGVIFIFLFKQIRGGQNGLFSFGKSKAKLFLKGKQDVTFKDVAGVTEAKQELEEIVDFLKHPKKYKKMGARTPKGVILVGPSGVGKTLLARAVAGEADVTFFSMAGSEFMEMLVGVGASRVRDLFATAKKKAPAIIFIDEIDAIGRQRSRALTGGHDEREQTLNQILVEMDGFTPNQQVIVIAATNRGDLLDPALIRPGRFDRRIMLDMPDIEGRKKIAAIHAKGKPFKSNVDWDKIAKRTVGFSGADLENMLNEAAIAAARIKKKAIDMDDLEEAALKVKMGPEKKLKQTKNALKMTAYHESGHALVTHLIPNMDPVHRISIVSRGGALGHTLIPPKTDRYTDTRSRMLGQIASLLGGRAAEELVFKELTSGAASDISRATKLARDMVIKMGMSDLGPINIGPQTSATGLGGMWYEQAQISEELRAKADKEIKKLVEKGAKKAMDILVKNRKKLDKVAMSLLKKETLEAEDFEELMK
ncbi:MAG: ATP-dependent zinc metalloprotease FtsH, partial [Patescibacteria group bacterium]|nr:ATP-dependent zinc metalloprotease FtsH [Patescibacteria group bacterium]